MQLVAEYKIEFHGDEAVRVVGVVAAELRPRIIGWGIRFKLQMLCPQEDE